VSLSTTKEMAPLPRLVLIRGLPGTGKTTLAQSYKAQGYEHFEADKFFEVEGDYSFDPDKLDEAHAWCLKQTYDSLSCGAHVVVANVFASVEDIKPYTKLGFEYQIIEATGRGKSIHPIPITALRRMRSMWVPAKELHSALKRKLKAKSNVGPIVCCNESAE